MRYEISILSTPYQSFVFNTGLWKYLFKKSDPLDEDTLVSISKCNLHVHIQWTDNNLVTLESRDENCAHAASRVDAQVDTWS